MWRLCIVSLCLLTVACRSTQRLFTGEVYRVDTPWYDSWTDKLDKGDEKDSPLNLATYCFPENAESGDADPPEKASSGDADAPGNAESGNVDSPGNAESGDVSSSSGCAPTAYARAQASAIDRDRLQDVLIAASDRECDKHKSSTVGTNTGFNLGLSMLTSVLSGAATGFSATSTKTALSAAATFFSSTRAQLNEQVYRQLFIGTLLTAIDNDRQEQLLDIMARRRYPVPNDRWDPRSQGRPLELGRFNESSGEDSVSDTGDDSLAAPGPSDPAARSGENEAEVSAGPVQEETPEEATIENSRLLAEVSADLEPEERARAVTGDDTRRFYGIEEAIRDAAVYHTRCSFYHGLVRLTTKVEEFSPCRLTEERRERLLAEVAAMKAAGVSESLFAAKYQAYTSELEALNTKMASCVSGGGG